MAGIFPKASNVRRFWENILNRVDAIREVSPERWAPEHHFNEDRLARETVYSKWGAFLDEIRFDPFKWRIPPATLKSIEPAQLLSLEVAWQAFQDAGFDHRPFPRERTSVIFAVAGPHDLGMEYLARTMMPHYLAKAPGLSNEVVDKVLVELRSQLAEWTEDSFPGFLGNVVAGRIANRLDLGGTNYVVDAACASSLAAVHAGIAQLRLGWSDVALIGTVDGSNNLFCYQCFSKTHALSPGGHSRTFDDAADGIGLGEAVAAVVLKRLSDAERDGDKIYAVIKGIGSSSDGNNRSLTAPHPPGQVMALRRAYEDADVDPATVTLIEAHGTGTAVGDRSEILSLNEAFSAFNTVRQGVAVGSIKSMIGHTKTAAGLVGIIKTALALRHQVLPPTIGVDTPNRQIDFASSPFYVNSQTRPWLKEFSDVPRRAGVSAFGFGGTNFHVVMEEYDRLAHSRQAPDLTPRSAHAFLWRRSSREELCQELRRLESQLAETPLDDLAPLASACWTTERNRQPVKDACRLAIVASSSEELSSKLAKTLQRIPQAGPIDDPSGIYYSEAAPIRADQLCFLYPGQGSQAVGMLGDLVTGFPWSHDLFGRWNRLLKSCLAKPLTRYIYPPPAFDDQLRKDQQADLNDTRVAQPALGAVEVFATRLLERFGLKPGFAAGHSYGEYLALCAAGCIGSDDLLSISAVRGRIAAEAGSTSPGAMAAVGAEAQSLQRLIDELRLDVSIANRNSPQQTVIGGTVEAVDLAVQRLSERGLRAKKLAVSAAFHTSALAPGAAVLGHHLASLPWNEPQCNVYSNTLGGPLPRDPQAIRDLLQRHFVEPVLFEQEVKTLHSAGEKIFIEVGPGRALTGLVEQILPKGAYTILSLDAAGRDGVSQLAHVLASAAVAGLPVDLQAWFVGCDEPARTPAEIFRTVAEARKPKPTDWLLSPKGLRPLNASKPLNSPDQSRSALPVTTQTPADQVRAGDSMGQSEPRAAAESKPSPATLQSASVVVSSGRSTNGKPVAPATEGRGNGSPTGNGAPATRRADPAPAPRSVHPLVSSPPLRVSLNTSPALGTSMEIHDKSSDRTASATNTDAGNGSAISMRAAAECQSMLVQWMELQKGQQQITDRFLRIQERILLGANLDHANDATTELMHTLGQQPAPYEPSPASPPASPRVSAPPRAVRPTPVTPSRPAIHLPTKPLARSVDSAPSVAARPLANERVVSIPSAASRPQNHSGVALETTVISTTNGAAAHQGPPSTEQFRQDLLQVVSDRTGYPVDMLDEELPLEAGLGIDSIKTVEVFSKLKTYHVYFQRDDQDEEEVLKVFTRLKTLGDIIRTYDEQAKFFGQPDKPKVIDALALANPGASNHAAPGNGTDVKSSVNRFELEAVAIPATVEEKKNLLSTT